MTVLNQVDIEQIILYEQEPVSPKVPTMTFGGSITTLIDHGVLEVAGSASDATLTLPTIADQQFIIFMDDSETTGDLTLKINGSAARALTPIIGLSEDITTLTVSNGNASARQIRYVIGVGVS